MVTLGVLLLIFGLIFSVGLLFWFGLALVVMGLVFNFAPTDGPRRRWY